MKSLFDILFTSCYFTCTWLVLEISLFGSIAVNIVVKVFHIWHSDPYMDRLPSREIDREGRNRYCNTYFVSPLFINCREYEVVTTYAKRKLKYSQNEILLHYGEWDRIVTLTGEQAD
jgi:hypothetical protein